MHEAECMPRIFGCNAFPVLTIAIPECTQGDGKIRDEVAHYSICPIPLGIISDACHIETVPNLHDLAYGNDVNDVAGALVCVIAYHVDLSPRVGNRAFLC